MGVATKTRVPLPAPTDDGSTDTATEDIATDVSRATDKTSYSIPDDGSPVTFPTKSRKSANSPSQGGSASQTSLLIEYFEGGRPKDSSSSRPSVRVKVTPSSKKSAQPDYPQGRKPSYTRRISLTGDQQSATIRSFGPDTEYPQYYQDSISPIEGNSNNPIDPSGPESPIQLPHNASEISSMPADSMLDAPLGFKEPDQTADRSLNTKDVSQDTEPLLEMDSLKAPDRTRSISRDRILRKAAEKVSNETRPEESGIKRRSRVSKEKYNSGDIIEDAYADYKARSRRSSKTQSRPDSGDYRSNTDSSFVRPKDVESNVSGASRSSLANNPKLLQTVEDAIRRLILPEINEIKRQQSVNQGDRAASRNLSKSTSAPQIKQKGVRSKDHDEFDERSAGESTRYKRSARSSRDDIYDESTRELAGGRRSKGRETRRSSDGSDALTTAALKDHNAHSRDRDRRDRRERRKKRSKSGSRSGTIALTAEQDAQTRSNIPPMPMASDNGDSDLTRESILSAESNSVEQQEQQQQLTSDNSATRDVPLHSVATGSPMANPPLESRGSSKPPSESRIKTPTQTEQPSRSARTMGSYGELKDVKSDRNMSGKARAAALAAAGIGGAASAVYGLDRYKADRSRSRGIEKPSSTRDEISPIRSTSSQREIISPLESPEARPISRVSSEFQLIPQEISRTNDSAELATSMQYPLTQKRHQGVNLEKETEIIGQDPSTAEKSLENTNEEEFYREQHQINNEYRASAEFDPQDLDDIDVTDSKARDVLYDEQTEDAKNSEAQQIRDVGANPKVVNNSDGPESAVASLHDPSQLSTSQSFETSNRNSAADPFVKEIASHDSPEQAGGVSYAGPLLSEHQSFSRDRWVALRESARALSGSKESLDNDSPPQSATRSVQSEEVKMTASGLPRADDPMPEIGHGVDAASDSLSNPSLNERKPSSVLESPLGDANENRDHWPYEATPPTNKRHGWVDVDDKDEQYITAGNAALMGAAAGLGIGATGVATRDATFQHQPSGSLREVSSQSSSSKASEANRSLPQAPPQKTARNLAYEDQEITPGNLKDEGYISAAQQRSPDSITPLSFSKPPPRLFEDKSQDRNISYSTDQDPFVSDKRARYISGNSHGMSSPYFDASTGKGMNSIQSKDVVALMDHLTVRDGQRNARDTEILVTLVRSAAEMHNSFDEMKKLIQNQGEANIQNTEKGISKILNAPRPQVLGSPRTPASTEDLSGKRKNIFKRALKGLNSKSSNDISRLEDMLVQLLDEVEGLKASQANTNRSVSAAPQGSLDSYERLRAAPESGYDADGQVGALSTPNRSGYLTPQSRQVQPRMHSGYDPGRESDKRISTVLEHDEEADDYADEERLLTPTQEARKQRAFPADVTPRGNNNEYNYESPDVTPFTDEKNRKTKSGNSSLWGGIPRISRWSKTTSSSENRTSIGTTPGRVKDRPYSEISRSGSEINVLPPDGAPWVLSEDDRLRSADSIARDAEPSQSPMVQAPTANNVLSTGNALEDPKYKANRNSLTLQHPQPRQGPTPRHKSHLENEAYAFGDSRDSRELDDHGELSPNSDAFGSVPSLARLPGGGIAMNRLSASHQSQHSQGQESSPISTEEDYQGQRDIGMLTQSSVQYQSYGPSQSYDQPLQDNLSGGDVAEWDEDIAIPLSRKRSPYAPGGLLAPIEERYSMEGDRSSIGYSLSQRSRRESIDAKHGPPGSAGGTGTGNTSVDLTKSEALEDVAEMDETERAVTPVTNPRPALGAVGGEVRKLTGPREMPRKGSGETGGLRGTLRRKPASGIYDD